MRPTEYEQEPASADRWTAGATHLTAECPGPIELSRRVERIDDEMTVIAIEMLVCVPVDPGADGQHPHSHQHQ